MSNSEPLPEGTVIMADNQFAGRGQQQNKWQSEPGKNLTFSIYLKPVFLQAHKQFLLNMAVSLGLNDALRTYLGNEVCIKWPNDIYFKGKKLGGMLIENILNGQNLKSTIIGIGLNINQQDFPIDLSRQACSMIQILHKNVNLNQLLAVICSHIESQYLKLKALSAQSLKSDYLERLYRYGEIAAYRQNGQVFEGIITDISDEGKLLISIDGMIKAYDFKEIEFIHHPEEHND